MDIHARQVSVNGPTGVLVPPTSLRIGDGELALVVRGEHDTTAFGLVLTGRMEPDRGAVLLDGYGSPGRLRALTTLVDSPGVTEPDPELRLESVLAEELALAGRRADRAAVAEFLHSRGADHLARNRFDSIDPAARIELLADAAAQRREVRMLVLDTPDRHTGDPSGWWSVACEYARRGHAVVVLCADATAVQLGVSPARLGAYEQPVPLRVSDAQPRQDGDAPGDDTSDGRTPDGGAPEGVRDTERTGEIPLDDAWTGELTGDLSELAEENR